MYKDDMNDEYHEQGSNIAEDPIRCCIRIRPLNKTELKRQDYGCLLVHKDNQTIQFQNTSTPNNNNNGRRVKKISPRNSASARKQFTFDYVMNETTTQERVFELSGVREMIDSAIGGYSTTIFAYGQTGSGKTFTISGEEQIENNNQLHGILPRSAGHIYSRLQQIIDDEIRTNSSTRSTFKIRASYLEIWNEQINDLLNMNSTNLPVRWSNSDGFFVENLFVVHCTDADDFMAVVTEGVANRSVAAHDLNKDSSRSHSIFTVYVDITERDVYNSSSKPITKNGKIHFVDLAGSERLKESKSSGGTAVETGHINKSLLTLGKVINTLSDPKKLQQAAYIPYRDSKLTKLLMDALGGFSKTVMIACVTPSNTFADETLNTLKYANRVKNIRNKPIIHMDPNEKMIMELREEIKSLRTELSHARVAPFAKAEPSASFNQSQSRSSFSAPQTPLDVKKSQTDVSLPKLNISRRYFSMGDDEADAKVIQLHVVNPSRESSSQPQSQESRRPIFSTSSTDKPQVNTVMIENEKLQSEVKELRRLLEGKNFNQLEFQMGRKLSPTNDGVSTSEVKRLREENAQLVSAIHVLRLSMEKSKNSGNEADVEKMYQLVKENEKLKKEILRVKRENEELKRCVVDGSLANELSPKSARLKTPSEKERAEAISSRERKRNVTELQNGNSQPKSETASYEPQKTDSMPLSGIQSASPASPVATSPADRRKPERDRPRKQPSLEPFAVASVLGRMLHHAKQDSNRNSEDLEKNSAEDFKQQYEKRKEKEAKNNTAATQIQKVFRGHRDRKKVKQMTEQQPEKSVEKERTEENSESSTDRGLSQDKSATEIQRVFRGFQGRKKATELKKARDFGIAPTSQHPATSNDSEAPASTGNYAQVKAATDIQRVYRGYRGRQETAKKKEESKQSTADSSSDIVSEVLENAETKEETKEDVEDKLDEFPEFSEEDPETVTESNVVSE